VSARVFGLLMASFFMTACSPVRLVNATLRSDAYRVVQDVPYGDARRQRLDVYRPNEGTTPLPVVIFFYGGSWQGGEKDLYPFVGDAFTAKGFVTVIPDYRVYPEVKFPLFVDDGAEVVRWVRDHAGEIGADPSRIYLMGHSAGAHIAALLVLDPRYLERAGVERSSIRAMVGLSGPYDFLPFHTETLRTLFGPQDGWPETQPIHFVDGSAPPMLLLTGRWDTTVSPGNTSRLVRRICEHGGNARAIFYRGLGHTLVIGALSRPLRYLLPVYSDVTEFLAEH
jgi:acetyl esterase/lipase